uniref:Putative glycoprotein n=1 Tax=Sichuan mosquito mivirus TaxID=2864020 RepID=A0A8K1M4G0_9VIRU|nr:putative glycoprotein [Sichuan mosquito mivirus]
MKIITLLFILPTLYASVLHPSIGSYMLNVDNVYLPETILKLVMYADIPCVNEYIQSGQFTVWETMIQSAESWLNTIKGKYNETVTNNTLQLYLSSVEELRSDVKLLAQHVVNLQEGKPYLQHVKGFATFCKALSDQGSHNDQVAFIRTASVSILDMLYGDDDNDVTTPLSLEPASPSSTTTRPTCALEQLISLEDDRVMYMLLHNEFGASHNVSYGHIDLCDPIWDILYQEQDRSRSLLNLNQLKIVLQQNGYNEIQPRSIMSRQIVRWDDDFDPKENSLFDTWSFGALHARGKRQNPGQTIEVISRRVCLVDSKENIQIVVDGRNYTEIVNNQPTVRAVSNPLPTAQPLRALAAYKDVSTHYKKVISLLAQVSTITSSNPYGSADHLRMYLCVNDHSKRDPFKYQVNADRCQVFVLLDDARISPVSSSLCADPMKSTSQNDEPDIIDCSIESIMLGNCGQTLASNNLGIRKARTLGDFIMEKMWKPMFGSASTNDLNSIKKTINDVIQNQRALHARSEASAKLLNTMGGSISKVTKSLASTQKELSKYTSSIKNEISGIKNALLKLEHQLKFNTVILHVQAILTYVSQATTRLRTTLNEIEEVYEAVSNMFLKKVLAPRVFSSNLILDIYEEISSHNDTSVLPPTWKNNDLFTDVVAYAAVDRHRISIMLELPMVSANHVSNQQVYAIHSMPLFAGKWVQFKPDHKYIVIQKRKNPETLVYTTLSDLQYERCKSFVASTCSFPGTWIIVHSGECLSSLVAPADYPSPDKLCPLVPIPSSRVHAKAELLSARQWLVHPGKGPTDLEEVCEAKRKGNEIRPDTTVISKTINITGLTVIDVPDACQVRFGHYVFKPIEVMSTYFNNPIHIEILSDNASRSSDQVIKWDTTTDVQKELSYLGVGVLSKGLIDSIDFNDRSLTSIRDQLKSSLQEYDSQMKNLTVKDVNPLMDLTTWWSRFQSFLYSLPLWAILVGILTLIVILWLACSSLLTKVAKPSLTMPAVAFSKVQGYEGSVITNVTELNDTDTWIGEKWFLIKNMITMEITMIAIMIAIMVVFMLLHHQFLTRSIHRVIHRALNTSGWYPRNSKAQHHIGEVPVTIVVLIKFERLFSEAICYSVGLQINTLPGTPSDWYLKARVDNWNLIKPVTGNRLNGKLIMEFDWTKMCLLSKRYPSLDTCHDMPPMFSCNISDLQYSTDRDLPWDWTKMSVTGLVALNVGYGHQQINLYTYSG